MGKEDLRKLSPEALHEKRKQVVRLKQQGYSGKEIETITLVQTGQISKIWRNFCKEGAKGLKPKARGRKKGEEKLLSLEQEHAIRKLIIDKTPDQLKFNFALWTRQAVSELVMHLYGINLSLRCVTNYLKGWGFTCQRPTKKPYIQDTIKVAAFMDVVYPSIAKRAKEENAKIFWGDETGVDNQEHYQRGFAPKGVTPIIRTNPKRERVNMISAIGNRGELYFKIYDERMTQQGFIDFMERMILDSTHKIFLIVDNLKVHHGKIVKAWLVEHKSEIELFFIPTYSPELNPDEYLNHTLKKHVHSGLSPRTKVDITNKVHGFMHRLTYYSEEVSAFFHHKNVRYILQSTT